MKKFLLDKINNYIPYLENNYPIFLENAERVVEFNFNFDENVMNFIEYCENNAKKKEIPFIVDSSLNDRFTDSKLIESNGMNGIIENVVISNNNVAISNKLRDVGIGRVFEVEVYLTSDLFKLIVIRQGAKVQ